VGWAFPTSLIAHASQAAQAILYLSASKNDPAPCAMGLYGNATRRSASGLRSPAGARHILGTSLADRAHRPAELRAGAHAALRYRRSGVQATGDSRCGGRAAGRRAAVPRGEISDSRRARTARHTGAAERRQAHQLRYQMKSVDGRRSISRARKSRQ
jgi:hypothetical protein